MARLDLRQHSLVELIIRSISLNLSLVSVALVYAASLLFLKYASFAPLPFETPLSTPPDWASWFDVYLTFPLLIILCLLPFRSLRQGSLTLLCTVAVIPIYLVFASYYFYYAQTPLGLWVFVIPVTLLVPSLIHVVVLATPMINSLILARNMWRDQGDGINFRLDGLIQKLYFFAIASLSVGLAFLQAVMRSSVSGVALTGWVSDIGITVDAGARLIVNGVNPYTHALPPWGGTGGTYGPVTYLLAVPFTLGIPGILIIPYIIAANNREARIRTLAGYVTPIILGLGALLAILPPAFLVSEIQRIDYFVGGGWLTPYLIFSPGFIKAISIITTSWLVFWFVYRSLKSRNDDRKLLVIVATFLLLIPFTAANYFAFFYLWGSAVALIAILSHVNSREALREASPRLTEVLR